MPGDVLILAATSEQLSKLPETATPVGGVRCRRAKARSRQRVRS